MIWKCVIRKEDNGYVLSEHTITNSIEVFKTFDEAVQRMALHFDEIKVGEEYKPFQGL